MWSRLFRQRRLVLVVCTANICRSPVAAAMLRSRLKKLGYGRDFDVRSAGVRVGMPGQGPDPRMKALAARAGLSLRGERAEQLTSSLASRAELIVVMEQRHIDEVGELLEAAAVMPSLRRLGDWYGGDTGADGDIADPYFANRSALEVAFAQLDQATMGLARELAAGPR